MALIITPGPKEGGRQVEVLLSTPSIAWEMGKGRSLAVPWDLVEREGLDKCM